MALASCPTRLQIRVRSCWHSALGISHHFACVAAAAMNAMNGVTIGSKQLVVRLHEPKQLRQEKLAQRFGGHNGHPRSSSGATSPTASEAGESYAGWPSPSSHPAVLGSPVMSVHERSDNRARRSSGSFYHVGPLDALESISTLNFQLRPLSRVHSTCLCVTTICLLFPLWSARKSSQVS